MKGLRTSRERAFTFLTTRGSQSLSNDIFGVVAPKMLVFSKFLPGVTLVFYLGRGGGANLAGLFSFSRHQTLSRLSSKLCLRKQPPRRKEAAQGFRVLPRSTQQGAPLTLLQNSRMVPNPQP